MQFYTMGQVKSNVMLQGKIQLPAERRKHFSAHSFSQQLFLPFSKTGKEVNVTKKDK